MISEAPSIHLLSPISSVYEPLSKINDLRKESNLLEKKATLSYTPTPFYQKALGLKGGLGDFPL